jgi:DNA-binding NtrC family response regulator
MAESARVLVVDDNTQICEATERILKERGYLVTTCSDSRRVIELLRHEPHACVLLDICMPDLEGTELLPIIKHSFPALPVIAVSAYNRADSGYYISLGAFEFLPKPFDPPLLLASVERAIGGTPSIPLVLTSLSLVEARNLVYRKLIVTALRKTDWNQVRAARLLGISRQSLIRWLRKLDISY